MRFDSACSNRDPYIWGVQQPLRNFIVELDKQHNDAVESSNMKQLSCKRCPHSWYPRTPKPPLRCPGCGSPKWNKSKGK